MSKPFYIRELLVNGGLGPHHNKVTRETIQDSVMGDEESIRTNLVMQYQIIGYTCCSRKFVSFVKFMIGAGMCAVIV